MERGEAEGVQHRTAGDAIPDHSDARLFGDRRRQHVPGVRYGALFRGLGQSCGQAVAFAPEAGSLFNLKSN